MRLLSVPLLAILAAMQVPAQTFGRDWFPHPANWYTAPGPNCGFNCPTHFPLTPGNTFAVPGSAKAQLLVPVADLPQVPSLLQDVAFLPLLIDQAFGIYHYDRLRVTFAQTTSSVLSTTFANNLQNNVQVVLDRVDHYWTPNGHANPALWPACLGLDVPYMFDPALGNLVIDIENEGAAQTVGTGFYGFLRSTTQTVASYGWSGTAPATGAVQTAGLAVFVVRDAAAFEEMGRPCFTSQNTRPFLFDRTFGQPKLGNNQRFDLVSGVPNALALMIGGFSLVHADLAVIGAPTCTLHPQLDFTGLYQLNTAGELTTTAGVPNDPVLSGLRVWFQIAVFDPAANPAGIAMSSYAYLRIGST